MKRIQLQHCEIRYTEDGCTTEFPDGATVDAVPHPEMPHYHVIAHRCGYEDDLLRYCREHDACHSIVAEWFLGKPSCVLHALAHKNPPAHAWAIATEEMMAQALQRYLRANEQPIISGVQWGALRDHTRKLLDEDCLVRAGAHGDAGNGPDDHDPLRAGS